MLCVLLLWFRPVSTEADGQQLLSSVEEAYAWYTARRLNARVYGYNTLIEEDTGHILGAHLVGPHAEDDIKS